MNTEPLALAACASPKTTSLGSTAPAVKPKTAKNPVVIYAFHCSEGSRGVYVGKHEVRKGDPRQWPSSGVGKLPGGYGGSGNWVKNARAKYGDDAFRWFVLEVVEPGRDYAAAEARAVAAAREEFGEGCKNIQNGGDGNDAETAQRLWGSPEYRARISESSRQTVRRQWQDPAYRQRMSKSSRQALEDPESRSAWHRKAFQKRLAAATKRRDLGLPPLPLDNLCLGAFDEARNPLPCALPKEPRSQARKAVLGALRSDPQGLAVPELCELLGLPERGPSGVRNALDNLRNGCCQPILNDGGTFILLPEGSY